MLIDDPGDLEGFGRAIRGLLDDPARAERLGKAAHRRIREGFLGVHQLTQYVDLIASLGPLPPIADVPTAQILETIRHDKKVVAGTLHFVLPTAIGATTIVDDVSEKELRAALKRAGFKM